MIFVKLNKRYVENVNFALHIVNKKAIMYFKSQIHKNQVIWYLKMFDLRKRPKMK